MEKESLFGKNVDELKEIAVKAGMKEYTGKQIADWLYKKDIRGIDEITNLSKKDRSALNENYQIGLEDPVNEQKVGRRNKRNICFLLVRINLSKLHISLKKQGIRFVFPPR